MPEKLATEEKLSKLCKFCWQDGKMVDATIVAPQFSGGDQDIPATWNPVCDSHFEDWYEDCEFQLPAFNIKTGEIMKPVWIAGNPTENFKMIEV